MSPCPFPRTITITPRAPPKKISILPCNKYHEENFNITISKLVRKFCLYFLNLKYVDYITFCATSTQKSLLITKAPLVVQWLASLSSKPSQVSSNLIGRPIHTALCFISAKVNYNYIIFISSEKNYLHINVYALTHVCICKTVGAERNKETQSGCYL